MIIKSILIHSKKIFFFPPIILHKKNHNSIFSGFQFIKLEMCADDTDAPAGEMLEVGNLLYTAQ